MGISLNSKTQKVIESRMERGDYPSIDELVQAAFGALEQVEAPPLDEATLDAIDRAEAQIARGEVRDWSEVRDDLRAKYLGK